MAPVGRLRWVGAGGAVLMAASAYRVGAVLGPAGSGTVVLSGWQRAVGLAGWLGGAALLVVAWWLLAERLPVAGMSVRWLVCTGVMWALPLALAPPLASRDVYAYACQGLAYVRGFDPYAAVTPVLPPDWLAAVPPVWRGVPAPYGPLWIVVSAGAAGISGGRLWLAVAALRVVAAAGVVVGGVGGWRLARRCGVAPATAVWLGILTPLVVVQAVSGAHNDAVLTALVLAGLAVAAEARQVAAARRRWWLVGLCGAAFGLAVAVKAVAVLAAPFAWLMLAGGWCVGAPPGRRPLAAVGAAFAAAATVAYTTVGLATGLGVGWVHGLAPAASMVEWSSPPTGVGMAVGYLLRLFGLPQGYPVAVAVARTVGLVVLAVIVARLWWAARAAASTVEVVGRAAAALVAGVALAPVFYPWYALTAAAVLGTCAGSRTTRRWLAGGSAVLVFAVLPDGYGLAVATKVPGAVLDLAVAVAAVVWWTRRRRRTRHDVPGGHRAARPSQD